MTFILLIVSIVIVSCQLLNSSPLQNEQSVEDLEAHLGISIPSDAFDVHYNYKLGRLYFVELGFSAPSRSMESVVQNLCPLYQGYNPFNAIDTYKPLPSAHLMSNRNFTYYSYSPNTVNTMWGNRCLGSLGHILVILINKIDPNNHYLHLESRDACGTASVDLPCLPMGIDYIIPSLDFPLLISGLETTEIGYRATGDMICLRISFDYYIELSIDKYGYLIGSNIVVNIGEGRILQFEIEEGWLLNDVNYNVPLRVACFRQSWQKGIHNIVITVSSDIKVEEIALSFEAS